ncbi:DsbA family protein [Nesterenkonia ebinurensis]|uniref:DsbA family protein n=1 Tax=Nesterenkonia ebinurensis TaxID=2608252 RepID=UPI00123D4F12|nr:thioredoxin domain-containing protein [Nesterenkonia ebinurensis]
MTQRSVHTRWTAAAGAAALLALTACGGEDEDGPDASQVTQLGSGGEETTQASEPDPTEDETESGEDDAAPGAQQSPQLANEHGGFVLTSPTEIDPQAQASETPHVVIFSDPGCPHCATLEDAFHEQLHSWLEEGAITLEYRSVNFVSDYSDVATNAFACMAEEAPEYYFAYLGEITAERGVVDELSAEELAERAEAHGADIGQCIADEPYAEFVEETTDSALNEAGIQGTPTIFIDGEEVPGDELMELDQHIEAAISG